MASTFTMDDATAWANATSVNWLAALAAEDVAPSYWERTMPVRASRDWTGSERREIRGYDYGAEGK